ncbi:hypothetical protein [Saccharopolyspora spinosa]|uniref:hypothetical protein n=1 Tax=Saccharopolyspora spinosa TaxID=60894 RepID=UPI00376F1ADE
MTRKRHQAGRAAAARVAELEELAGRGPLTDEQATELAELRSKVAARAQKKDRDVTETGVGDPVVGRGAADAGVMLGADAYEEFVATELPVFLGQDAEDDAAGVGGAGSVVGGFDFAGFLRLSRLGGFRWVVWG